MTHLGARIRARRAALAMTQGRLAEAAGVTASAVSQMESGKSSPSAKKRCKTEARLFDELCGDKPSERLIKTGIYLVNHVE